METRNIFLKKETKSAAVIEMENITLHDKGKFALCFLNMIR